MKERHIGALIRGVSALAIATAVIVACSNGDGKGFFFGRSSAVEDRLGTAFGTQFRASADTEPTDPTDSDVVPLSLTTEPVDF